MKEQPLVSICCISFNHEEYIAAALESFLEQQGDFSIEILIHDDASTDRTADIIRDYERRYPHVIKGIYQTENQYSKGIRKMNHTFNFNRASGKYIAVCEGDDFWTDPLKLAKQVAYMEEHPDCTFCFTNALVQDEGGKVPERRFLPFEADNIPYYYGKSHRYEAGELALLGFIPTASFFFRRESLDRLPDFYYQNFPAGDKVLSLSLTALGYASYLDEVTSVYRTNAGSSVMKVWSKYSPAQLIQHNQSYLDFYTLLDEFTQFRYREELDEARCYFEFTNLYLQGDRRVLTEPKFRSYFQKQSSFDKLKIYMALYTPTIYSSLRQLKKA